MKRKRDQENETREMRKLLNDKDDRIKLLDNEIKVNIETAERKFPHKYFSTRINLYGGVSRGRVF
jgi:hypothetical protein